MFFFSSRRRHTRWTGDWSSDVCSSDLAEWEGWDWISDFGDPIAEHHAVREAVGIWDESPLRKWFFSGKDAMAAVDYCFTADMAGPPPGQARYPPLVGAAGREPGGGGGFPRG